MPASLARPDYALADNLGARAGTVFMTGTQALIRLALMQRQRDAALGLASQGFISGYRGSPLGMVDQQAWKAAKLLDAAGVSSCRRSTRSSARPRCSARSGSSPTPSEPQTACSRCGTARARGSTAPATRSSTATPTARRRTAASWSSPATTTAASRRRCRTRATRRCSRGTCRCWRRPTSPSTSSSASTAGRCRAIRATGSASPRSRKWSRAARRSTSTRPTPAPPPGRAPPRSTWRPGFVRPADGLHYRWPDLPSLKIEQRLHAKLDAVRAFAKINSIDRDDRRGAARDGRHRHLRQGALRPARGVPPARHPARSARRRRRPHLQGRPRLSARADAPRRLRRRPRRDPGDRGEGRPGRAAAARPVLQPRGPAEHRRQARREWQAAGQRARRAAAVAADRDRRRLARGALRAARPAPPGARLHRPRAALERERRGQARAVLLRRLPAQHLDQGARGLARAGRDRLPLHGLVDGPRHRGPDPDGRRGRRLGLARDVHQGAARVPEPRRRHLLPLGLSGDPPGDRRQAPTSPTRSCSTTLWR